MKVIGVTGGVGSGKSEVLDFLETEYPCRILKLDDAAKTIEQPGEECYDRLIRLMGTGILTEPEKELSPIHTGKMAARMFSDPEMVRQVNGIVHPMVRSFVEEEIRKEREKGSLRLFFIEAALLIEAGYREILDELWYIYTRSEVRRQRLKASRGYSDEKINDIMNSQLSEEDFRREADFAPDNSGSFEQTKEQIRERLKGYELL